MECKPNVGMVGMKISVIRNGKVAVFTSVDLLVPDV